MTFLTGHMTIEEEMKVLKLKFAGKRDRMGESRVSRVSEKIESLKSRALPAKCPNGREE